MNPDDPVTRAELRDKIGRMLNAYVHRSPDFPTDPKIVKHTDLLMEGVDLYVEGLVLQAMADMLPRN